LRFFYFFSMLLLLTFSLNAEEIHQSPLAFEKCSNKSNTLTEYQSMLKKYKLDGVNYNQEYDALLSELNLYELKIQKIEKQIKENPSNSEFWEKYEATYKIYENITKKIHQLNKYGEKLEEDSMLFISKFTKLRNEISINCDGEWQIGIIRKYCNNGNDNFQAFCDQFSR